MQTWLNIKISIDIKTCYIRYVGITRYGKILRLINKDKEELWKFMEEN